MGTITSKTPYTLSGESLEDGQMAFVRSGSNYSLALSVLFNRVRNLLDFATERLSYENKGATAIDFEVACKNRIETYTLNTARTYIISIRHSAPSVLVLELKATAAVTLDIRGVYQSGAHALKWADGEELTTMASGDIVRLHITSQGNTDHTVNWINVEEVAL